MDSEILIKLLSLWPEYSTGTRLILLETDGSTANRKELQMERCSIEHPGLVKNFNLNSNLRLRV